MKYQILIIKTDDNLYLAYCPLITKFRALAENMESALSKLQRDFLCYLHDSNVEMEIFFASQSYKSGSRQQMPGKPYIRSDF